MLTGQNLWAEIKTTLVHCRLSESTHKWRLRRYKDLKAPFILSSPTSALGSGSMHDMRQTVYGTNVQRTVDYIGHDSPSSRDLFLNHYSPMGDPLTSATKPKLPESLGKTLSRKRENCLRFSSGKPPLNAHPPRPDVMSFNTSSCRGATDLGKRYLPAQGSAKTVM